MTIHDAELVGGVLVAAHDVDAAAQELDRLLTSAPDSRASRTSALDPHLVDVLRNRFAGDKGRIHSACLLGAAWVRGRRSVDTADPWDLVASLPPGTPLPQGLRRTTGETLISLISHSSHRIRLAAPFIDLPAISFLKDALAAATARGVAVQILLPTRSTHAQAALEDLVSTIRSEGDPNRLSMGRLRFDAPWAHLKVLSCDSTAAYIGSANVTGAGLAGTNLELGVLVRGPDVSTVDRVLDLFIDIDDA